MQIAKIVQAVFLLIIVALAASCATTNQYISKVFPAKQTLDKDSQVIAIRFLDLEDINSNKDNLVTTDIIMGRDTVSKTLALDNLTKIYPAATKVINDTSSKSINSKETIAVNTRDETEPIAKAPIPKAVNQSGVREKRTRED